MKYIVKNVSHYCNVTLNKCGAIPKHKINYYDFTFVLNGTMTYVCNGEIFVLKKNDAVFMKPGSIRQRFEGEKPVSFVSFNFTVNEPYSFPFDTYMENCITYDIRKLISVFSPTHLSQYYHSKEKVANILNYILLELTDTIVYPSKNEHIAKIIKYVDEYITESISLTTICKEINLSKEYTSSIFKKEMHTTLTDYINERKIRLAKELITQNGMALKDVAEYVGYKNYNYFSRLFKKYYNITPVGLRTKK